MTRSPNRSRSVSVNRRRAVQLGAGAAVLPRLVSAQADATPVTVEDIPVTGDAVPDLTAFDSAFTEAMARFGIPGGQLAIGRDNRLVYNRGFGYASVEDAEAVEPTALFRIASTSKPFTGVAILQLVDAGLLTLDTPVFPLLALEGPANAPRDPRLDTITVEQLLVHSGGWNSAAGVDPQYLPWPLLASHLLDAEVPAEAETIIRYMLSQPLDFDPGTASAYSNFGFNVLGRVVEHLTGQPYDEYVIEHICTPAGITGMAIGGTTLEERLPGEVRYYSPKGMEPYASVFPGVGFVPAGYGSYYMRSLDAHGGWISSAEDLVKFAKAIDGVRGEALLTPESVTAMETTSRPPSAAEGAGNEATRHGLAFNAAEVEGGFEWSHAGALEGSNASWLLRKPDGTTIAYVVNTLPLDFGAFFGEFNTTLVELLGEVTTWPETDLFS